MSNFDRESFHEIVKATNNQGVLGIKLGNCRERKRKKRDIRRTSFYSMVQSEYNSTQYKSNGREKKSGKTKHRISLTFP
jgi:hypothetical protein